MGLFKILIDASNNAFALTKLVIGQTFDNTVDGIAALAFRDSSGNATAPTLTSAGKLPVDFDSGIEKSTDGLTLVIGSQTKDVETLVGKLTISTTKKYQCFKARGNSFRSYKWRLAYIDDAAGTPSETDIGHMFSDAGDFNPEIDRKKHEVDTTGGTGVQEIALYATPLDKVEEVYGSIECIELV